MNRFQLSSKAKHRVYVNLSAISEEKTFLTAQLPFLVGAFPATRRKMRWNIHVIQWYRIGELIWDIVATTVPAVGKNFAERCNVGTTSNWTGPDQRTMDIMIEETLNLRGLTLQLVLLHKADLRRAAIYALDMLDADYLGFNSTWTPSRKICLLQAMFFDTLWWSHGLRLPRPSENGNSCRRARYSGYWTSCFYINDILLYWANYNMHTSTVLVYLYYLSILVPQLTTLYMVRVNQSFHLTSKYTGISLYNHLKAKTTSEIRPLPA